MAGCGCGKKALPGVVKKSTAAGAANASTRTAREPRRGGPGEVGYAWTGPKRKK